MIWIRKKQKKRGRPAQLLQIAELHAFVEFLLEKDPRSELQNQVIDALQAEDFNFDYLSEAQQILVKEALKTIPWTYKVKVVIWGAGKQNETTEYLAEIHKIRRHNAKEREIRTKAAGTTTRIFLFMPEWAV